jgi:UDP-glucose 4-epimerase
VQAALRPGGGTAPCIAPAPVACHDAPVTTVLVTGGAGFIGSHLCDRLLAEGKRVVALDDLSSGHIANLAEARGYGKRFNFHHIDVRADGLSRLVASIEPELVVHLAATREDRNRLDVVADARVSVMGLLNVLIAATGAKARKIVFASSGGIYGDARRFPIKETSAAAARPLTPSAIARKAAEDYLRFHQRWHGLDYTILVLGSIYGPRQYPADGAGVIAAMAGAMLGGHRPSIDGDGNQTRDFVFVDDAVHAFALAADRGSGKLLNIGTGVETSINGLFRSIAHITGFGYEPRLRDLPRAQVRRIGLDSGLAAQELGWKPWTHLEDGLRETVAYLREG